MTMGVWHKQGRTQTEIFSWGGGQDYLQYSRENASEGVGVGCPPSTGVLVGGLGGALAPPNKIQPWLIFNLPTKY